MRAVQAMQWSKANWFVVAAPVLVGFAWLAGRFTRWTTDGQLMEAALLFDACVTLPGLYALCYARTLKLWQLAVRMVAIACLGIYLLSYVVPAGSQVLLPGFAVARTVGLGLVILFELRIAILAVHLLFGKNATAEQISAETGAPLLIAKLMLIEARMWKGLGRFLRGR